MSEEEPRWVSPEEKQQAFDMILIARDLLSKTAKDLSSLRDDVFKDIDRIRFDSYNDRNLAADEFESLSLFLGDKIEHVASMMNILSKSISGSARIMSSMSEPLFVSFGRKSAAGDFDRTPGDRPGEVLVYFAWADGVKKIKIGASKRVANRIRGLKTAFTGNITLLGVMRGGFDLEKDLHGKFSNIRFDREWFNRTKGLLKFIEDNAKSLKEVEAEIDSEMKEEIKKGVCLYPPVKDRSSVSKPTGGHDAN